MDKKYNRILPESEGNVFCAEVGEKVCLEDYNTVFEPAINKVLEEKKNVRILLSYTRPFHGWGEDAAIKDLANLTEVGKYLEKVALVYPPEPVLSRWQILKPLLGGELKIFEEGEFQKALSWVKN